MPGTHIKCKLSSLLTLTVVGCFLRVEALSKGRETAHFSGMPPCLDEIGPCAWSNGSFRLNDQIEMCAQHTTADFQSASDTKPPFL